MKKLASWLFAFALLFSLALPTAASANTDAMKFLVDGVEVEGYEQPFMSHGDVLIPVENLFDEAGFKVTKGKNGAVSVTNTHLTVDFNAAGKSITVNGKKANAEFPLTLKNAGNYVSGEFLSSLEGFDVEVSEDEKTVNVKTNRVQDVDAFLKKTLEADLKSYSADMKMDMKAETSTEELGSMDMHMDMKMDVIQEPMAMYMAMNMLMKADGEKEDLDMEMYFTENGVYQKLDGVWIKDEMSQELLNAQLNVNPLEQFELLKALMKGVHIFEYEDTYVVVQKVSTEDLKEMISDMMEILPTLLPAELLGGDIAIPEVTSENVEVQVDGVEVTEETTEEVAEEATEEEVDENVIDEEVLFEDLDGLFEMLNLDIKEFYTVSTYDKATLFPHDMSGTIHITMSPEGENVSLQMTMSGKYKNHNNVKEIKVPEEVIKNAITMEQWFELLEKQMQAEEVPAK